MILIEECEDTHAYWELSMEIKWFEMHYLQNTEAGILFQYTGQLKVAYESKSYLRIL
jgi:hypothetical protein